MTFERPLAAIGLAALVIPMSLSGAERADWNVRRHIPLDRITVQSHRGAGELMPENSMDAFELAWSLGTVPEADLRTTRDGVIVAFHDENFKRILPDASGAQVKQGIKDLAWDEVRKLDIGAWKGERYKGQRVPALAEILSTLAAHPERRMYIDIKNVDLRQLAKQAREARAAAQLILASTLYPMIREWKALTPESATLHWMGGTEQQLAARFDELRKTNFADITQLQIHVRLKPAAPGEPFTPSPAFLLRAGEELRRHGILFQVLPYEVKDPRILFRLMDLGVASFATDYPDLIMQAIRDYYAQ